MDNGIQKTIALAGNPNVGKSTIFNRLTGLKQHTGNWPGKTVEVAEGFFTLGKTKYRIVDLPGTYSLSANSEDEVVARDFICFGESDAVAVVADATALERNLNLLLQILEIKGTAVLCVNLMDQAKKQNIKIDLQRLEKVLEIPVCGTGARSGEGMDYFVCCMQEGTVGRITDKVYVKYPTAVEQAVAELEKALPEMKGITRRWAALKLLEGDENAICAVETHTGADLHSEEIKNTVLALKTELAEKGIGNTADIYTAARVRCAEKIAKEVTMPGKTVGERADRILTSKILGIPIMLLMLCIVFWITVVGANYPSKILAWLLFGFEKILIELLGFLPQALKAALVDGMYHTLAWVVSVMLPPMAIFFPLFALLEESGFLPRIAFNMDKCLSLAKAHGRQALTMCQGFGCNACGVMGCRIINSPRERLVAIITNNFVPCNGRFPTIILLITIFFSVGNACISAAVLLAVIAFSVCITLAVSRFLSETLLKGQPSSFVMELPTYRKPELCKVIVRSFKDRTLFVLSRAVIAALPAGALIWICANIFVGESTLLCVFADVLEPLGKIMGMDGYILLAFVLGFPANEIVIPILVMCYTSSGNMTELTNAAELGNLLEANGWNVITAMTVIAFSVMHFPCATTCQTIYKETKSIKWTAASIVIPTVTGMLVCIAINAAAKFVI